VIKDGATGQKLTNIVAALPGLGQHQLEQRKED
jgi:hypothetical protein